ncbi:hypothetical protein Ae201684_010038 [Aphanomyces euteiches]|uniref:Uncharacterized protein n=1 Tax=Aphanomyces euteiches TaxID=100861 RepID=A0A6G0WZH5_9STRA|nr:hypothetical protein Ae201684_010038 [Aphanomyces euteiches]
MLHCSCVYSLSSSVVGKLPVAWELENFRGKIGLQDLLYWSSCREKFLVHVELIKPLVMTRREDNNSFGSHSVLKLDIMSASSQDHSIVGRRERERLERTAADSMFPAVTC